MLGGSACKELQITVVLKWLWVVGLRRCARGKCMQRVVNRILMVVKVALGGRFAALC